MKVELLRGMVLAAFVFATTQASGLAVVTTDDAEALVDAIVGSGITVNTSSISYTGTGTNAAGFFTDGLSSGLGVDQGIILTTGNAADAVGPNTSGSTSTSLGLPGDADLDGLIPGFDTFDAVVLEFEFETTGGDLFFNFIFASEEYNEFVGSQFNDVFGFFVNGENIALIPGTSTPVAINNVNNDVNSEFYNDNDFDDFLGMPPFDIEYDGFTTVFTAEALGLGAGTHTIRIAIADAGDSVWDSAVFIQGETFSDIITPPVDPIIPEPATVALMGIGLAGLAARRFGKD